MYTKYEYPKLVGSLAIFFGLAFILDKGAIISEFMVYIRVLTLLFGIGFAILGLIVLEYQFKQFKEGHERHWLDAISLLVVAALLLIFRDTYIIGIIGVVVIFGFFISLMVSTNKKHTFTTSLGRLVIAVLCMCAGFISTTTLLYLTTGPILIIYGLFLVIFGKKKPYKVMSEETPDEYSL